ncbi:MAG: AtpZ/AtpI family protein [Armatimonadetes bacterium]|nr:AtpZ/AtpI family protein [Armatimonadota bacterium]
MTEKHDQQETREELEERIGEKAARKLRARAEREESVWFGLGMFGLVGWSVAIPTVLFLALGLWIDRTYPSSHSWTLMMLVLGIGVGAFNAWYWMSQERKKIERPERKFRD